MIRRQGAIPNDLNLRHSQRLSALLAVATFGLLVVGAMFHSSLIALPLMVIGVLVAIDRWTDRPPRPDWLNGLAGLVLVAGLVALVVATPIGRGVWSLWALGSGLALGGIVALNLPFYRFLARTKGLVFMALSIPLHVTYYLSSVVAFGIGTLLHLVQPARGT